MLPFTLQQLRSLKAIQSQNNFTKAANVIYISQPSLSKHIKRLEKNIKLLLIKRDKKKKIFLTKNGEILLRYSERILALSEEICHFLTELKKKDRGSLNIGLSQIVQTEFLAHILILMANYFPQFNVRIEMDSIQIIYNKIVNQQIDIAIIGGKIPMNLIKNSTSITKNSLIKEELNLILSKLDPLSKKKLITQQDLHKLKFITLDSNSKLKKFGEIDKLLNLYSINLKNLNIVLRFNSIQGVKIAVSLGFGVAFLCVSLFKKEQKLNLIHILNIANLSIKQTFYVLHNSKNYKSRFFELISQKIEFRILHFYLSHKR